MAITKEEAAARLDGNQYREEGSKELFFAMKEAGLVAVFGASDDLMEFRGAIDDEVGCYDGGEAYLTRDGLLTNDCDNERCPHFEKLKAKATKITALWCDEDDLSWTYALPTVPHADFIIKEDSDLYCRGIVFALADVPSP
jgi:hypothetical protein